MNKCKTTVFNILQIILAVMRKRAFGVTVLAFSSTFLLSFWMPVTDKPYETVLDNPIFVTFMLLQGVAGLALGIIRFVKRD